eukprot:Gregarina_sp_Pseudo_9__4780@NODE_49_length_4858_cov_49_896867_g46_i0_p2_GENE_NODE_49_length_4858_cov_49_896867_g46_i0NODE_49_length_4858_cov_49_896867_g46_i0_p2_ORF_typecomplete_len676_score198_80MFS_1/PF07690_16/1e14MFS_1/PF07690_16/2_7e03UNC93/PF05978_16/8_4e14UNC93/PF05978_16/3_4e03SpoIIIAC/PF06686_11/0_23_NODE_49_length_4858_cov_49_896867_g46_i0782105
MSPSIHSPQSSPSSHHVPSVVHRHLSKSASKPPLSSFGLSGWIRLAWTQIVLVSLVCTLSRGTLNALNAVGGLGTGDVQTATMVNLLSSISFSLLSWSTGGIVNIVGYRMACSIGSFTTTITLSTLMFYTMFHLLPSWLVWLAATCDGIGSGILWTASGTILIKYPSERRKGFASTVLFAIYSLGAALGGLMAFAMNMSERESTTTAEVVLLPPHSEDNSPLTPISNSGLKPASYALMISLAGVAFVLSMLLKRESEIITRSGNPLVEAKSPKSCASEIALSRSASRREPSRLSLVSNRSSFKLFSSQMPLSAERRAYVATSEASRANARTVRSHTPLRDRSLTHPCPDTPTEEALSPELKPSASKMIADSATRELRALVQTLHERNVQFMIMFSFASLFHQTYLFNGINYRAFNVRTRGLNCFMYWVGRIPAGFFHGYVVDDMRFSSHRRGLHGLTLLLFLVATCQCLTVFFWTAVPQGRFDVMVDPANAALAFVAFFLYGGLDTVSQSFALWIFSCLGRKHPSRVPHYVALFRSFQGFGVALAWFLDLNSFATYNTQFLVCAITWLMALPGLVWVIYTLPSNDAALMLHVAPGKAPSLVCGDDSFQLPLDVPIAKAIEVSTQPSSHGRNSNDLSDANGDAAAGADNNGDTGASRILVTHDQMGRQMDVEVLNV